MANEVARLRQAGLVGEIGAGAGLGFGAGVILGMTTGFWEVGVLLGTVFNQRRVLRQEFRINPDSDQGQTLLRQARSDRVLGQILNRINPPTVHLRLLDIQKRVGMA